MRAESRFLETLDDLRQRTDSGSSDYDLTQAAGLLRRLLLDGDPLVHQVNRSVHLKFRFTIGRKRTRVIDMDPKPTFWTAQDGLDPDTAIPSTQAVSVKLDEFLREAILYVRPFEYSVHEVVDYLAHIEGGVHSGQPNTDREKALSTATDSVRLGVNSPTARSMQAVSRVVLKALAPLEDVIAARVGA